jgi:hypothetical protein
MSRPFSKFVWTLDGVLRGLSRDFTNTQSA